MENKKTVILSILGVLVLVIAVVGVSFAMYSFSAAGTRENTITTGSVSIAFPGDEFSVINLDKQYVMSDTDGLKQTATEFSLVGSLSGTMTVNYDVGFVELTQGNTNLTADKIKIMILEGADNYLMGSETTGATLSSIAAQAGETGLLTDYVFDHGTMTGVNGIAKHYKLKAWIDSSYVLKGGEESTANEGTCSDNTKTTADACKTAGGVWTQTKATTSETFSFKLKVMAAQV